MPAISPLLNKKQAAELLGVSQRTFDRWRQSHDTGEVRLTPRAAPRFRRAVLEQAVNVGSLKRKR